MWRFRVLAHLGRRHPVEIGVTGDVKATLEAIIPRLTPRQDTGFLDDCVKRHEKAFHTLDKRATIGRGGRIHPQYLTYLIDQYAADDAVFSNPVLRMTGAGVELLVEPWELGIRKAKEFLLTGDTIFVTPREANVHRFGPDGRRLG